MKVEFFQFTIWQLLFAAMFFSVALAIGNSWEVGFQLPTWALFWLVVCHLCSCLPLRSYVNLAGIGIAVLWGFSLILSLVFSQVSYDDRSTTACKNKMLHIAGALDAYERKIQHLQMDSTGQNLVGLKHSWRVELLPFLGEQDLYNQYDFTQPWNSNKNSKLIAKIPSVYQCLNIENSPGQTCFKFVTGAGTLFDGGPTRFSRVSDGTSNTVAIVEDVEDPIEWTRPSDIEIDKAVKLLTDPNKPMPHCNLDSVFYMKLSRPNLACFDGSIHEIGNCHSHGDARKLFGISDGFSEFGMGKGGGSTIVYKFDAIFLMTAFVVLASLTPLGFKKTQTGVPVQRS